MREFAAAELRRTSARCGPGTRRRSSSRQRGEPLKVQLIEEKTAGQSHVSCLHHQGPRHVRRLLRRAARAVHGQAQGVQADDDVERVLEGRREERADAAHLRHGVLQRQGPREHSDAARGGEETRSPQARARSSGSSRSTRGRRARRSGWRRARCSTTRSPTTCAACSSPPATVEVKTPIVFNKALWETSGHWQHYRENMFLVESEDGEEMGLKAMNCPGHYLLLRQPRGTATATCRSGCTSRRRCTATRRRACWAG